MSLLTTVISAAAHALPATRANRLLILIYHRVHARPDPMFPGEVDAERFDWQMDLLRRRCSPMPLADAVAGLRRGRLPARAVAVTFDDGYADNEAVALPILQRHRVPATFFVTTGFLDGGRMWNDSVIEAVRRAEGSELDVTSIGLGKLPLGGPTARGATAESILKAIKHRPPLERARAVEAICQTVGKKLPDHLMMTSQQVRNLAAAGMEIGAHTMTHPILKTLADDDARLEIDGSRQALERIIGRPVRAFAYPNGRPGEDYEARDRKLVESLGFEYTVSTVMGAATKRSDVWQLPRFTPWDPVPTAWFARLLSSFRYIP
jgi:peptidoglycan/xylan/chitin deacetylase (PgdA/CDA1 family)